ncbi:MAG: glutathione synthase [Oscillospiraceae bacterium]|nr:glutathione synthase [Oscillospiraceae bacterium]
MQHPPAFYQGKFGIERETLRVDRNGRLAQTPHPFGDSETITRDFCENQIELVTPVCSSVAEAVESLRQLDRTVRDTLAERGETLWLSSNPPHIENEAEIPVANFTGMQSGKRRYREQLERRYGKRLMLFSGIHFNLSFSEDYLREICTESDYQAFRTAFYLRLYQQALRHSWLPLLLTAASPFYDRSLDADGASGTVRSEYASMRSSVRGYWNEFVPVLRFDSISGLTDSIRYYVEKGLLFSASELYLPVRLKPRGTFSLEAFADGISHIELRMFDLNPLEPLGICETDLEFAHLLMLYLSSLPAFDFTPEMQRQAVQDHQNAALYDPEGVQISGVPILERAEQILTEMRSFFAENPAACEILDYEQAKLQNRLCTRISNNYFDRG